MKFLLDMPIPPGMAGWLRERGHDAVHAAEIGLARAPDQDLLDRAVTEKRVVILGHSVCVVDKKRIRHRPLPLK
jgi:predicted nuclease of predicted toxin-antitoxin system